MVDGMQRDGLNDAFDDAAMGTFAELCADEHAFSREDQVISYSRCSDDVSVKCCVTDYCNILVFGH